MKSGITRLCIPVDFDLLDIQGMWKFLSQTDITTTWTYITDVHTIERILLEWHKYYFSQANDTLLAQDPYSTLLNPHDITPERPFHQIETLLKDDDTLLPTTRSFLNEIITNTIPIIPNQMVEIKTEHFSNFYTKHQKKHHRRHLVCTWAIGELLLRAKTYQ